MSHILCLDANFQGRPLHYSGLFSAFDAEVEHWLRAAWSVQVGDDESSGAAHEHLMSQASSNGTLNATSASCGWHSQRPLVVYDKAIQPAHATLGCTPGNLCECLWNSADGPMLLLSGSDRNAALSERVVSNHADMSATPICTGGIEVAWWSTWVGCPTGTRWRTSRTPWINIRSGGLRVG